MSDGCWVQFWDDKQCDGATLRIDGDSGTGATLVDNLDDYTQSDGREEGNEPDSLVTGTRAWLIVYEDKDFEGKHAKFGPNTKVNVLDDYGMGGNISSFKLYDYEPEGFTATTSGSPIAVEQGASEVNAGTVNDVLRSVVSAAASLIPEIGSPLSALIGGLWPDVTNRDQVWGSVQNYLNEAIAGVFWQTEYAYLSTELESLFNAAGAFVEVPVEDKADRASRFENLLDLVNDQEAFFVDKEQPWTRFTFLATFATLRLATLYENLVNYVYYYGSEPSAERKQQLTDELVNAISEYRDLLTSSRKQILDRRDQMIYVDDDVLIDLYNGVRISITDEDSDVRRGYSEGVWNLLAQKLDTHIATSQLWVHFDPTLPTTPVELPVLTYTTGPQGYFFYTNTDFSQSANGGRLSAVTLWTIDGTSNPAYQNGLELFVNGSGQGRAGGTGGDPATLNLASDEAIVEINGSSQLYFLQFVSSSGKTVSAGDPVRTSVFWMKVLPNLVDAALVGVSGSQGTYSDTDIEPCVRALSGHWQGSLSVDANIPTNWVWSSSETLAEAS